VQANYQNSEYCKSEFQFSDSPDIRISKKNPVGIFGIKNRIGILLLMGVPEIGTKNWNSKSRSQGGGEKMNKWDVVEVTRRRRAT
jgi:hypothetical protein